MEQGLFDADYVQEFGSELFDALFTGDIRRVYDGVAGGQRPGALPVCDRRAGAPPDPLGAALRRREPAIPLAQGPVRPEPQPHRAHQAAEEQSGLSGCW